MHVDKPCLKFDSFPIVEMITFGHETHGRKVSSLWWDIMGKLHKSAMLYFLDLV